ncbi:MAG: hypothetical protein AB7U82_27700 [Blastocatellales bacterium]
MNVWYCKECGQDSAETSNRCEICDAPRATAGVATLAEVPQGESRATFEVDGEQIAYAPETPRTASPLGPINLEIARKKKDAGL